MGLSKEEITKITADLISKKASEFATQEIAAYEKKNPVSVNTEQRAAIENAAVSEIAFLYTKTSLNKAADDSSDIEKAFNTWFTENESKLRIMVTNTIKEKTYTEDPEEESGSFMDRYLKEHNRKMASRHKI